MNIGFRSLIAAALAGTALTAFSAFAVDADPKVVGRAAIVQDVVKGRTTLTDERVIKLDDILFAQEQVVTGPKSKALIEFRDGTTLELGPNGALTIDKMVFDPEGGKKDKAVSISRGLFRLVSGAAAPDSSTTIKTPSGTIGIRGSLIAGVVPSDANQPTVFVGGSGNFTVTNGAGTTSFTGGQAVAVSGRNQAPTPPGRVPDVVAGAVVQSISSTLGTTPPSTPPASPGTQQAMNLANTVPATQQQQQQQSTQNNLPTPPATGAVNLPAGTQAAITNNAPSTPQQQQQMANYAAQQQQVNDQAQQRATQNVVQGLSTVMNPTQLANSVNNITAGNPRQGQTAQNASGLSQQQLAQASTQAALPPALQAAVNSGNAQQIQQAVQVLSGGNPQRAAVLAQQVVTRAEQILATNPQAAVNAAAAALQVVANLPVQTTAPSETLQTTVIAARIFVNPTAQRVAPETVANGAASAARIVTNPTVYQASPQAAIQVMANAYGTVSSPGITATNPNAQATVAQVLSQAAQANGLNAANQTNSAQIQQILGQQAVTFAQRPAAVDQQRGATGATGVLDPSETPLRSELNSFQASPT
ncbi:hypothetical protein GCM10011497_22870 [Elstera cyanobacteriorum]|uniref:FecR protein domain-containing protein n=1 Tax=Elstera cyanobacteriorum TaxID=2022747 RepID=A0A255XRK4_9PROT|nr:FecR family protein [Elstera cyanobacteriorum]OYQ19542.1 hypothetical protein CHR90_09005 [Elstera cyanobacteriorum]GFZ92313.1 hypothetical protein GCM10011497_22870 [Elstera cyanobacteriorum]